MENITGTKEQLELMKAILRFMDSWNKSYDHDFPKPHIVNLSEPHNEINIEFIIDNSRVIFSVEESIEKSTWVLADNRNGDMMGAGGYLSYNNLDGIIEWIVHYYEIFGV